MNKQNVVVLCVFSLASAALRSYGDPATITLGGTIRDFASDSAQATANGVLYDNDFENAISDDRGIVGPLGAALGGDGTPVYAGGSGTVTTFGQGAVTAAGQFQPWYHNNPNYNVSIPYSITLNQISPGIYNYNNNSFFPIDNQGFGNFDGSGHNFSFTYQIATLFTYQGPASFSFSGDDDVWVYINNKLVIDLGGVHGDETEAVDVSTLGLTVGNTYNLDVFFAERHTVGSDFAMTTGLQLSTAPTGTPETAQTAGLLALGVGGLAVMRRRLLVSWNA